MAWPWRRRFQTTYGQHRPCCGGACLVAYTGWDNLTPVTLCMLLIPSALWFFFYGKDVSEKICPILPVLLVIIVSLTLILLLLIMFTEPGILPTVTFEEYNEEDPNVPVRIISRIVLDGREYELKEFRARFSRYTGNCIESFDHFCGWTGAAIGKRNYRYFVIFLGLCLFLAIGLAGSCTALIVIKADEQNIALWKAIKNSLGETLLAIYGYVMLLSLIGLFGFHLRAIATNQTTNEILKATYGRGVNPYDQGCFKNYWTFLCAPIPRSRVAECDVESPLLADRDRLGNGFSNIAGQHHVIQVQADSRDGHNFRQQQQQQQQSQLQHQNSQGSALLNV